MATHQTFVFIGRSGCGKGTQAKLLMEYLQQAEPERDIYYLETGQKFREFLNAGYLSSELAKRIMEINERQPDFLAVYMWSHLFVENMKGDEHLVLDGTPRSRLEAEVLDTALRFYNRADAHIVHINVSREWSEQRLTERGRADDVAKDGIKKRLDWFDRDVVPAIEYYHEHREHNFHEINGERGIDEVHRELLASVYDNH